MGHFSMWVNGCNLCSYNEHLNYEGDLYYLIDWFCEKLPYIIGYDNFPLPVKGDNTLELIENANKFKSEIDLEIDLWFEAKSRWIFNHGWFSARGGAVLPYVYFRRKGNLIEISWNNLYWQNAGIDFKTKVGVQEIEVEIFIEILKEFLIEIINNSIKFYISFSIIRINTIHSSILRYRKTLILPRIYHD